MFLFNFGQYFQQKTLSKMIQRIQTVFWAIIAILFIVMIPADWMSLTVTDGDYIFSAMGVSKAGATVITGFPLMGYLIGLAALNIVTIFLYKKRVLQARLSMLTILLSLCFYLLVWMYRQMSFEGDVVAANWMWPLILPLINAILAYLARRGAVKDEEKVRSLDRLR